MTAGEPDREMIGIHLWQPWDDSVFRIPTNEPSFGWHDGNLLVIGDPLGYFDPEAFADAPIRMGFAQHGPLVILMMKSPGIPGSMLESPRSWLPEMNPPEITVTPEDHILWSVIVVSKGIVVAMRAFTTNPRVTVFLRRAFAEQRAFGQLSYEQADMWIDQWQEIAPDERAAWNRTVVSSLAGD